MLHTLRENTMRNGVLAIVLLLSLLAITQPAYARGGQGADDCPAGSTDPDCKGK